MAGSHRFGATGSLAIAAGAGLGADAVAVFAAVTALDTGFFAAIAGALIGSATLTLKSTYYLGNATLSGSENLFGTGGLVIQ